ncbi:MAG: hypothetical protein WED10_11495 [Brumimicrobium sp.]
MKLKIIFLLLILPFNIVLSQVGMGEWRMHISPNKAIDVAHGDGAVYAILSRGLLEYDLTAGEQTLRTAANYLSDVSPTALAYDKGSKTIFIGYENGNLDLLKDETIFNLPAILQSTIGGLKRINNIKCKDGNAYLATGFGIVVINVNKREVRDTYNPTPMDENIIDIALTEDSIYALTEGGMFVGALSNNFLADPSQWEQVNAVQNYTSEGVYNSMVSFEDELFFSYNNEIYNSDTLYHYTNGQLEVFQNEIEIGGLSTSSDFLLVSTAGSVIIYNQDLSESQSIYQYSHGAFVNPENAIYAEESFYLADKNSGLVKAKNAFESEQILFEGPRFNSAYNADWQSGKLAVGGGGINSTNPAYNNDGGYTSDGEAWRSFSKRNQPILDNKNIWDFISVAVNPSNTDQIAFGTYSELPIVLIDDGVNITDTFGYTNSLLSSMTGAPNGIAKITDLTFDDNSNLWVANSQANRPLKVRTEDGNWYDFDLGSSVSGNGTRRVVIDQNDVKWMGVDGIGVVAFDHGDELDDPSDDQYRILTTSPNSGDLPISTVEGIAVDFDNNIWVGTPEGMRVLYNTNNIFEAAPGEYNFQKLLIEFGENVEIVLGTTQITDIEIDGANRKWIGTANSGVFLLSPDGLEVEKSFSVDNSPLLSNNILDITIDQNNGEVYFVTNDGLISYRSDASTGDDNYSNVKVFPNPVHPDYFGPVTIQGIAYNSDVKITDVAGNLVYQTTSNGGTATWNGKTLQGERVQTGVYLIWTSIDDPDRKGREVGKVVFIN